MGQNLAGGVRETMSQAKGSAKRGKRTPLVVGLALALGVVVVVGGAMIAGSGRSAGPIVISPMPQTTDSVQGSLVAFRGKVVILDFWATWCGPCRMEIPTFIALQNKYRDRGLEIVGVSIDPISPKGNPGGAPAVAPFMRDSGINYTILMVKNPAALSGFDVSRGIPTTYVLDRSGKVVRSYVGVPPKADTVFENDINALL